MEKWELTPLDAYNNRVYRIIVLIIPIFCLCASATITVLHYIGWYPVINETALWLFVLSDVLYLAIGIHFIRIGFNAHGIVEPSILKRAKYTMAVIVLVQWNGISYIWPFSDFWAFAILFVIVEVFFFDVRLTVFTTVGITLSMLISWFVKGTYLLPARDAYFNANMVFRSVGLILMLFSLNLITYFGGKFLVEELEKFINYDTLTHLLNRRCLDNYLECAYKQAKTGKSPFCLLMVDIDDFKKVNDTYGHDCGDAVLKEVSSRILAGVRDTDTVFRWGGEEILVLLRADEDGATQTAERIRTAVCNLPVDYRGTSIPVSITIGIAAYHAGTTIQQMMDAADERLYYGKKHGKNQVVR